MYLQFNLFSGLQMVRNHEYNQLHNFQAGVHNSNLMEGQRINLRAKMRCFYSEHNILALAGHISPAGNKFCMPVLKVGVGQSYLIIKIDSEVHRVMGLDNYQCQIPSFDQAYFFIDWIFRFIQPQK